MKMTPLDIQQQQFKTRFRGFDVREVDTFLEQTAGAFETVQRENGKRGQGVFTAPATGTKGEDGCCYRVGCSPAHKIGARS